jgi:hypothetical protein
MGKIVKYLAIAIALAIPVVLGYLDYLEFWDK